MGSRPQPWWCRPADRLAGGPRTVGRLPHPGLAVHRASATYRGEGKTDAKDAFVIADQARIRRDLGLLRPGDEIAVDLRTLTTRRLDGQQGQATSAPTWTNYQFRRTDQ